MNKIKILFRCAAMIGTITALITAVGCSTNRVTCPQKEEAFLEQFPQLKECTVEQQEDALAFYQESEKVQELLSEVSQAIEISNAEQAQEKINEAAEVLDHMAEN